MTTDPFLLFPINPIDFYGIINPNLQNMLNNIPQFDFSALDDTIWNPKIDKITPDNVLDLEYNQKLELISDRRTSIEILERLADDEDIYIRLYLEHSNNSTGNKLRK